MVVRLCWGGVVIVDEVNMFQSETVAMIKKDLLTHSNIACRKDADPVMSGFGTDIGLVSRGESRIG